VVHVKKNVTEVSHCRIVAGMGSEVTNSQKIFPYLMQMFMDWLLLRGLAPLVCRSIFSAYNKVTVYHS
jgi:hypothetical protein